MARARHPRKSSYNYEYSYAYGPQKAPELNPTPTAPGPFLSEAAKSTLGPIRRALVREVEDRRMFYLDTLYRAQRAHVLGLTQRAAKHFEKSERLIYGRAKYPFSNPKLGFTEPKQVPICVRRKERREVLLAKGKGGGNHKPPRRNNWSDVEC